MGAALILGYLVAVAGANWASSAGCVAFGSVLVPAGALLAGLVFTLRDAVDEWCGPGTVLAVIAAGTAVSAVVASPRIAVASAAAFLLAELVDAWLYARLRRFGPAAAIAGSNLAGLTVDSVVFVQSAFGSWDLLVGHLLGKTLATVAALGALGLLAAARAQPPQLSPRQSARLSARLSLRGSRCRWEVRP